MPRIFESFTRIRRTCKEMFKGPPRSGEGPPKSGEGPPRSGESLLRSGEAQQPSNSSWQNFC